VAANESGEASAFERHTSDVVERTTNPLVRSLMCVKLRIEVFGYMQPRQGFAPETAKSQWKEPLQHPKRAEPPTGGVMGWQVQRCVLDALDPEVAVVVRHAHTQPTARLQQVDARLEKTPRVRDMFEHLKRTDDVERADVILDRLERITQCRRSAQPLRDADSLRTQIDPRRAGRSPITQHVKECPDAAADLQHLSVLRDIVQGHPVFPLVVRVVPRKGLELPVQVFGPDRVRQVVR
jgi:hypothetical protein